MSARMTAAVAALTLLLAGALFWWWWSANMVLAWKPEMRMSEAASANPMLAATLLLRQNGHTVRAAASVAELPLQAIPDGTLIVADAAGVVAPERAAQLLAWVQRGNTLVTQPRWINPAEKAELDLDEEPEVKYAEGAEPPDLHKDKGDKEDDEAEEDDPAAPALPELVEVDPLSARLGVRLYLAAEAHNCRTVKAPDPDAGATDEAAAKLLPECVVKVTVPGAAYPLVLSHGTATLLGMPDGVDPVWGDEDGSALRVYREGKGHVVMVAADFFTNQRLRRQDHAELLLTVAGLNAASKTTTIVNNLDVLTWYQALWKHFKLALISAGIGLALLFWAAVRRFGPIMPRPGTERRSLIEHIDASGAWLWKANGGGDLLLEAAREDTLALLRRRAPALFRLPAHELPAALARATGQHASHVSEALQPEAARQAAHFTRQIRTLQELRTHYER